jgi:hypothetical protein
MNRAGLFRACFRAGRDTLHWFFVFPGSLAIEQWLNYFQKRLNSLCRALGWYGYIIKSSGRNDYEKQAR